MPLVLLARSRFSSANRGVCQSWLIKRGWRTEFCPGVLRVCGGMLAHKKRPLDLMMIERPSIFDQMNFLVKKADSGLVAAAISYWSSFASAIVCNFAAIV